MTINVNEVKRRLNVFLNDNELVDDYMRRYGPIIDIKNIKEIKNSEKRAFRLIEEGPGNNPIYEINVKCPVCKKDGITCYELRAKSQKIDLNKFLVPCYKGMPGYKTVYYTSLNTTVCPRCLFASPDKKDFIRKKLIEKTEIKSLLNYNILMALQEKTGERKTLLESVTDYENFFHRPRCDEAAIASMRLSIMRTNVEKQYDQPYSFYKLGSYSLRIAKIEKDIGLDNSNSLTQSLEYMKDAFRLSNCPSEEIEMQIIYTIIALYLKLGKEKNAHTYLETFSGIKKTRQDEIKENPKLDTNTIEKWERKAKALWEDRDMKNLFENE